jgi:hypothetical protein
MSITFSRIDWRKIRKVALWAIVLNELRGLMTVVLVTHFALHWW